LYKIFQCELNIKNIESLQRSCSLGVARGGVGVCCEFRTELCDNRFFTKRENVLQHSPLWNTF